MTAKTTAILGSVVASFLIMGQVDASQKGLAAKGQANTPQPALKGKSTLIYQTTKDMVQIFNNAENQQDALYQLCGKGTVQIGKLGHLAPFRANKGKNCTKPDAAVYALNICGEYIAPQKLIGQDKNFDNTLCAKEAKIAAWGNDVILSGSKETLEDPNTKLKPLSDLKNKPMRAIENIHVKDINGVPMYTNQFAPEGTGIKRNLFDELKYSATDGLKEHKVSWSNIKYLICYSKRANLPKSLQDMLSETQCKELVEKAGEAIGEDGNVIPWKGGKIPQQGTPISAPQRPERPVGGGSRPAPRKDYAVIVDEMEKSAQLPQQPTRERSKKPTTAAQQNAQIQGRGQGALKDMQNRSLNPEGDSFSAPKRPLPSTPQSEIEGELSVKKPSSKNLSKAGKQAGTKSGTGGADAGLISQGKENDPNLAQVKVGANISAKPGMGGVSKSQGKNQYSNLDQMPKSVLPMSAANRKKIEDSRKAENQ